MTVKWNRIPLTHTGPGLEPMVASPMDQATVGSPLGYSVGGLTMAEAVGGATMGEAPRLVGMSPRRVRPQWPPNAYLPADVHAQCMTTNWHYRKLILRGWPQKLAWAIAQHADWN